MARKTHSEEVKEILEQDSNWQDIETTRQGN